MKQNATPEGCSTVSPYLVVEDPGKVLDFLIEVFDAEEMEKITSEDGTVMHMQAKVGDTVIMAGRSSPEFLPLTSMIHIYTEDTDAVYQRALNAGAEKIMEPADQFYGDRNAGVKGPMGNYWWIATHFEDLSKEELLKRAREFHGKLKNRNKE